MPDMKGNKIGVMVYFEPETYNVMMQTRNKYMSCSAYCAMLIDEILRPDGVPAKQEA